MITVENLSKRYGDTTVVAPYCLLRSSMLIIAGSD